MSTEIEIKLDIAPESVNRLLDSEFLATMAVPGGSQQMDNCYFDTPELALNERAMALRIRERNGQCLQTLKTKGIANDGLHQRLEWEWPLQRRALDAALLPSEHWPSDIVLSDLVTVFETNFSRDLWYCEGVDDEGESYRIEIALDRGEVLLNNAATGQKTAPISELELELLHGSEAALIKVCQQLCEEVPVLTPSDISKAQRGFALLTSINV